MRHTFRNYASLLAFLLLAAGGMLGLNALATHTSHQAAVTLYHTQLKACHDDNILRFEINRRVTETNVTKAVVVDFLRAAQAARHQAFVTQGHHPSDDKAADSYAMLAARESKLHYHTVPIINCDRIHKP